MATISARTGNAASGRGSINQDANFAVVMPEKPKLLHLEFALWLFCVLQSAAKLFDTTANFVRVGVSLWLNWRRRVSAGKRLVVLVSLLTTEGEIWVRRAKNSTSRGCLPTNKSWLFSLVRLVSLRRAILQWVLGSTISHFHLLKKCLQSTDLSASTTRVSLPLPESYPAEAPRKITSEERNFEAYKTLRTGRANARFEGARKTRAAKVSFFSVIASIDVKWCTERGRGGCQEEVVVSIYTMIVFLAMPTKTSVHYMHSMF